MILCENNVYIVFTIKEGGLAASLSWMQYALREVIYISQKN